MYAAYILCRNLALSPIVNTELFIITSHHSSFNPREVVFWLLAVCSLSLYLGYLSYSLTRQNCYSQAKEGPCYSMIFMLSQLFLPNTGYWVLRLAECLNFNGYPRTCWLWVQVEAA